MFNDLLSVHHYCVNLFQTKNETTFKRSSCLTTRKEKKENSLDSGRNLVARSQQVPPPEPEPEAKKPCLSPRKKVTISEESPLIQLRQCTVLSGEKINSLTHTNSFARKPEKEGSR